MNSYLTNFSKKYNSFSISISIIILTLVITLITGSSIIEAKGKPGGGGSTPPLTVPEGTAVIDGNSEEWEDCTPRIPLHWAGKANKIVLNEVCLRVDHEAGLMYLGGFSIEGNPINDKPESMHLKIDKVNQWIDSDRPSDETIPDWEVWGESFSAGGYPTVIGWEAVIPLPEVGEHDIIVHASSCPERDCNLGAGQSSRTLRGTTIEILEEFSL